MKYSEKKIIKAVTEIYERVLSPQEIKANELIEKFNAFMKEVNDSIDLLNEDIEDFNNTYNLTYDNGGMKFLKHTSYNEWALKNISKLLGDWEQVVEKCRTGSGIYYAYRVSFDNSSITKVNNYFNESLRQ